MDDLAIVEQQLGRAPRAFRRVAVRCPFGRPAVTEQRPFDDAGTPFPTQFWLTCPHLVAQLARLEAGGGVDALDARRPSDDPELAASLAAADAEQRELRPELPGGIGGATRTGSLKCLHAHAAFALARPGYELGDAHPRRGRAAVAAGRLLHVRMIGAPDGRRARPAAVGRRAPPGRTGAARLAGVRGGSRPRVDLVVARAPPAARRRRSRSRELADVYADAGEWARDSSTTRRGRAAAGHRDRHRRGLPAVRPRRGRLPPVTLGRAAVLGRGRGRLRRRHRARPGARRQRADGRHADARAHARPAPRVAARTTVTVHDRRGLSRGRARGRARSLAPAGLCVAGAWRSATIRVGCPRLGRRRGIVAHDRLDQGCLARAGAVVVAFGARRRRAGRLLDGSSRR